MSINRTNNEDGFIPVNEALLNVITPMGLEFRRNSLVIGENTGKVYGIIRYPQKVDYGWLSKITNIPSTVVTVDIKPIDNGTLINSISKSIIQNRGIADSAKDPLTRQRAEKAAEDAVKAGRLMTFPLPDAGAHRQLYVACRRGAPVSGQTQQFIRFVKNFYR